MREQISPATQPSVAPCSFPGDKSISHRYAMLAAIAEGTTQDSELFERRGLPVDARVHAGAGRGMRKARGRHCAFTAAAWKDCARPPPMLDAGNSGSTIRMLSGILAAQPFATQHRRRRIAVAPAHGAHHDAAGANGRAHRSARESISAADHSWRPSFIRWNTRCPWRAPR